MPVEDGRDEEEIEAEARKQGAPPASSHPPHGRRAACVAPAARPPGPAARAAGAGRAVRAPRLAPTPTQTLIPPPRAEAKSRAVVLEMIGDLPEADAAPPANMLFVCKLNPVTTEEDLEIIFSRWGG